MVTYTHVNIELPDGILVVPFPVADRCGVNTPGMGVFSDPGTNDNQIDLVTIDASARVARGQPTTIGVTLESFEGTELPPVGYAIKIAGVETRLGLPTEVKRLLPGLSITYDIQIHPPATLRAGATQLQFELLTSDDPGDQVPITLT